MSKFSSSLSLLLNKSYKTIKFVTINFKNGDGFDEKINER